MKRFFKQIDSKILQTITKVLRFGLREIFEARWCFFWAI